ncbi:MAG: hypothetical protein ACPG19_07970 [Saprospiraceae bacterium]
MRNKYIRNILLFCSLIIGNLSCTSLLDIERQKDFSLESVKVKQIVCINPSFNIFTQNTAKGTSTASYSETVKRERVFNKLLSKNALKNGIILQIIDTDDLQNNDASYFNYLAPLRKEILQVNYLQNFEDINKNVKKGNSSQVRYDKGPKISTHYSHLAEIYGTSLFAVQGLSYQTKTNEKASESILSTTKALLPNVVDNQNMIYFTIIADVSKSEIVYREYRQVDGSASEGNLNSIIYDSFKIIAN